MAGKGSNKGLNIHHWPYIGSKVPTEIDEIDMME